MTTFIEYKEGKVYDPAHLKPFDLDLAKAGHPLANFDGTEVSHLFESISADVYSYRGWSKAAGQHYLNTESITLISERLYLAPLAIKDGRPLHVGDWATVVAATNQIKSVDDFNRIVGFFGDGWRFADEVTK
jgi:hypothetical protein